MPNYIYIEQVVKTTDTIENGEVVEGTVAMAIVETETGGTNQQEHGEDVEKNEEE